jgi:hypothetical protein
MRGNGRTAMTHKLIRVRFVPTEGPSKFNTVLYCSISNFEFLDSLTFQLASPAGFGDHYAPST